MQDKKDVSAYKPPIYEGDQDKDRLPHKGPAIRTEPSEKNRGRRAAKEGSGVPVGSGAAAGGSEGVSEDYDKDPIGGDGSITKSSPLEEK